MVECDFTAQKLPQTNPWDEYSSYQKQDSSSHFHSVFPATVAVSFTQWTTVQFLPCLGKPEHMSFSKSAEDN